MQVQFRLSLMLISKSSHIHSNKRIIDQMEASDDQFKEVRESNETPKPFWETDNSK
jgi:hypothetical protein